MPTALLHTYLPLMITSPIQPLKLSATTTVNWSGIPPTDIESPTLRIGDSNSFLTKESLIPSMVSSVMVRLSNNGLRSSGMMVKVRVCHRLLLRLAA